MGKRRQYLPQKFTTMDELYQMGFCLKSDICEPVIVQSWVEVAISQGLSIPEVANQIGSDRQGLHNIALGNRKPSIDIALRIAEVLHCSVDSLFALSPAGQYYQPCRKNGGSVYLNKLTLTTHKADDVMKFEQSGYNYYNELTRVNCPKGNENTHKIFEQIFFVIARSV